MLMLLLSAFVVGLVSFREYGVSWDEPLFYAYADAIPYAYSIRARISGDFNIEQAYGPSSDHKVYGPAYLLLARPSALAVQKLLNVPRDEAWHLVNFATFELGAFVLYLLCRRWMSHWPAFGAALLFLSQPILWGHGFINPKDMPFTVFFLLTIYTGFRMVDKTVPPPSTTPVADQGAMSNEPSRSVSLGARWLRGLQLVAFTLAVLAGVTFLFDAAIRTWLTDSVLSAYYGSPDNWLHRLFLVIAQDASRLSEDYYVSLTMERFRLGRALMTSAAFALLPLALDRTLRRHDSEVRFANSLARLSRASRTLTLRVSRGDGLTLALRVAGPAVILGLTTAIRVVGPLAGLLVIAYFILRPHPRSVLIPVLYVAIASLVTLLAWPYLWGSPWARLVEVATHMADNPHLLPVLYDGMLFSSGTLPASYLPTLMVLTLTESVLPLAVLGVGTAFIRFQRRQVETDTLVLVALWFLLPFTYDVVRRPPIYDGYRHFLFILPPLFVLAGVAFQAAADALHSPALRNLILLAAAAPGIVGILRDGPYSYAHYNAWAGGWGGAFRRYETDYWLTCYKETLELLEARSDLPRTLFVLRNPPLAQRYAGPGLRIVPYEPEQDQTTAGSWLLLPTRSNADLVTHPGEPIVLEVGRGGAVFCVVKEVGDAQP